MNGQLLDQNIQLNEAQQNFWDKKDVIAHAHEGFYAMLELLFDARHRARLHPQTGREIALFAIYAHRAAFGDFYRCPHCAYALENNRTIPRELIRDFHMLKQNKLIDDLDVAPSAQVQAPKVTCEFCEDEGCYRCQPTRYRKATDQDFMVGSMTPNGMDSVITDELERYGVEIRA